MTAVVAGDQGNLRAEGPDGAVPAATPFSIRTFWDEDEMDADETWYGSLTLGTVAGSEGDIGVVPVTIERVDDDVTKTADVDEAAPGDTVTYTVEVAPNVTPEDLTYTITDRCPRARRTSRARPRTARPSPTAWSRGRATWLDARRARATTTSPRARRRVAASTRSRAWRQYLDLKSAIATLDAEPRHRPVTTVAFTAVRLDRLRVLRHGEPRGLWFTDDGFLVYGVDS